MSPRHESAVSLSTLSSFSILTELEWSVLKSVSIGIGIGMVSIYWSCFYTTAFLSVHPCLTQREYAR